MKLEENKYYYRTYYNGVLYVEKLTRGAVIEGFEYLKHKMRMGYGCTPPYANY
jgi:hypothetical protein